MILPGEVTFEVAFDTDPSDEPGVWTDLSDRVRRAQTAQGHTRAGGQDGQANLTLNNFDRALDPTNDSSPHNLVPMRHARLTVEIDEVTHPVFRGFVEDWPPMWRVEDGPNVAEVQVRLIDATAYLALQDHDVDLPRQQTHDRINTLLDLAGWPSGRRDISDGRIWVTEYEQPNANLLRMIVDTADAEDGELHVNPDGTLVFDSRHARFGTSVDSDLGEGGLPVEAVRPEWSATRLINVGRVELESGETWEAVDEDSQDAYGPRVFVVRDLSLPPREAEALARWMVIRFAQPSLWLDDVTLQQHAAFPEILERRIGDKVKFTHSPPGGGQAEIEGHVERIQHRITPQTWQVSLDVAPDFGDRPWLIWDQGKWDDGKVWAP